MFTVAVPLSPPAINTELFDNEVAVCPCTAVGIDVAVAVQVVVPFQSSPEASELVPFEPPTSKT